MAVCFVKMVNYLGAIIEQCLLFLQNKKNKNKKLQTCCKQIYIVNCDQIIINISDIISHSKINDL